MCLIVKFPYVCQHCGRSYCGVDGAQILLSLQAATKVLQQMKDEEAVYRTVHTECGEVNLFFKKHEGNVNFVGFQNV